jgi:hypothetical protein
MITPAVQRAVDAAFREERAPVAGMAQSGDIPDVDRPQMVLG